MSGYTLNFNPPDISTTRAYFAWTVPYAAIVHEGAQRVDGTWMPARPFTDAAIQEIDIELSIADLYQESEDLGQAFRGAMYELSDGFQAMILDPRWGWDRPTVRSDGSVVFTPRNIYDEGDLLRSQTLAFDKGGEANGSGD